MKTAELEYQVHNYMEDIVKNLVKETLREKPEVCNCQTCLWDICALVLNQVKPEYLEIETNLRKLSPNLVNKLRKKILDAMVLVANNPRSNHGQDSNFSGHLQNLSEALVRNILQDILENHINLDDNLESIPIIASMVLNQLEPRYAVTDKGGAYMRLAELEHQFLASTMAKIFSVIKQFQE